jgi:hypothetical protein
MSGGFAGQANSIRPDGKGEIEFGWTGVKGSRLVTNAGDAAIFAA